MRFPEMATTDHTEGRVNDPERICAVAASFGMALADDDDIVAGREIAARLIGEGIASAETFIAMQRLTRSSVFVFREDGVVTGMLGLFLLRPGGLRAVQNGAFDAVWPDMTLVAPPGERPAACYGWGFAATSERGGSVAVRTAVALQQRLFWAMPTFTRTATPDGVRVILGPMGYQRYTESDPSLVWRPPSRTLPAR
jgi:hypothetical protein